MKKSQKIPNNFFCNTCNYNTINKKDFNKHLLTAKHIYRTNRTENPINRTENPRFEIYNLDIDNTFKCICGKVYKARNSLWYHKRKCTYNKANPNDTVNIADNDNSSFIIDLIKQNNEFKQLIIEQNHTILELAKKDTTTNNNTINNNNNQKFNLNFFLNNTCKDAMNMSEFIENIEVQFKDIENIGKNGYINGMTEMILSRIKNMDVVKRPLHCTDLKRETMYIKDNNEWEKDTPDNKNLQKMISMIAKRNYATIPLWRNEHPECEDINNPLYNFNIDILRNVLGDVGDGQIKLDKKVIKNLSKHITVEKNV